ncbi:MAG: ABC transporter ATP-binding protein [Methanolinea sp.]|jgi:tungstate transport system ATP-binding protein|nr:ABC transporter ATP-binding protein [Methanolinea sp.]
MIRFDHVSRSYGEKEVLCDISFEVREGEIFTLVGPSGTGKTTILRIIAMLEDPGAGTVAVMGTDTRISETRRVALRRQMGMVFQKPAALRGSVAENVALGLKFRKFPPDDISRRVSEVLDLVGLSGYEGRKTSTLSGGELQRVAIARALAPGPRLLLLDEPTANLDPVATEKIENLILSLNEESGITIVLSTHDMAQAQRLASRIAVVLDRKICQLGNPFQIFYQPGSREVARMVGIDNILAGEIVANEGGLAFIDVSGVILHAPCSLDPGTRVTLFVRPEDLFIGTGAITAHSSPRNVLPATILRLIPQGPNTRITVDAGVRLTAVITRQSCEELGLSPGMPVSVSFKANAVHVVPVEKAG